MKYPSLLHETLFALTLMLFSSAPMSPEHTEGKKILDDKTPLMFAIINEKTEAAQTFLDNGADIKTTTNDLFTALHFAALYGNYEIAASLVRLGADVNAATTEGATPLHLAAQCGGAITSSKYPDSYYRITDLLLKHGALSNTPQNNGATPLFLAALSNSSLIALLLGLYGSDVPSTIAMVSVMAYQETGVNLPPSKGFIDASAIPQELPEETRKRLNQYVGAFNILLQLTQTPLTTRATMAH